jgi:hypothetical protein
MASETELSPTTDKPLAVCVLGMHRSGTSALTRLLNLLGVDLGENLLPGRVDNPKGFWEHRGILDIHDDLLDALQSSFDDILPLPGGWHQEPQTAPFRQRLIDLIRADFGQTKLWGFKDPRTCRLLPMWLEIFADVGAEARFVFVVRDPGEIALSLEARDGYSFNTSLLLTLTHLLEAESATRNQKRVFVTFEQLLSDWRSTVARVAYQLDIRWPRPNFEIEQAVNEFIDPRLRHHSTGESIETSPRAAHADPDILRWVTAAHAVFVAAANGGPVDSQKLDDIRREFQAQQPRFETWRNRKSPHRQLMKLENWAFDLRQQNNWLRLSLLRLGLEPANIIAAMQADRDSQADLVAAAGGQDTPLAQLKVLLAQQQAETLGNKEQLRELLEQKAGTQQRLQWLDSHVTALEKHVTEQTDAITWLETQKKAADGVVADQQNTLEQREKTIGQMQAWSKEQEAAQAWLAGEQQKLKDELVRRDQLIRSLQNWSQQLESERNQLQEQQAAGTKEVASRDERIKSLETWADELDSGRRWLSEQLEAAKAEIAKSHATNEESRKWITELETAKTWLAQQREKLEEELKLRPPLVAVEIRNSTDEISMKTE